jgi:hypothetical protein
VAKATNAAGKAALEFANKVSFEFWGESFLGFFVRLVCIIWLHEAQKQKSGS